MNQPVLSRLKRLATSALWRLTAYRRVAALEELMEDGLPELFSKPARYLVTGEMDPKAQSVRERVEARREQIAAEGDKPVNILYSPKPGSSGVDVTADLRPDHGEVMSFTMERVARTGKGAKWGTFLHLLARNASGLFLELGSCAGISASYIASSPTCKRLLTVEGSPALAELAQETTSLITPGKVEVISALFDEALDTLLPDLGGSALDFAYIDGHHERVATLHYFERIKPVLRSDAVVVFDDVSWSADMRAMWEEVVQQPSVVHAADFGTVGVIVWNPSFTGTPRYWNLQPIVGRQHIGKPWGWRD